MVKSRKRERDEVDSYQSDGGFVSNDDGKAPSAPKSKKPKKASAVSAGENKDEEGNPYWELSSGKQPRRVAIQEFKNMKLIAIREHYFKDEKIMPGKKGISLTVDQYTALLKAIPQINASLKNSGVAIDESDTKMEEVESEADTKPQKRVRAKTEKKNIEATSDEEE